MRPTAAQLLGHSLFVKHGCKDTLDSSFDDSVESLSESMSAALSRVNSSSDNLAGTKVDSASSPTHERITELDYISENVLRYFQRRRLSPDRKLLHAEDGRELSEFDYREWGDPSAVPKLYLGLDKLKRLAKQLGLPSHVVIRKFDKKAQQLMGTGPTSPTGDDVNLL